MFSNLWTNFVEWSWCGTVVFMCCSAWLSCSHFSPLPHVNLPSHLRTQHDALKSTGGLHQSWRSCNQTAELWKMEAVTTTCRRARDAAGCQSERPLPLHHRHFSLQILRLDARLNYWLKCKFFIVHPTYILIMDELYMSDNKRGWSAVNNFTSSLAC